MPSDPFGKVRPGERLSISSTAWNAMLDVARVGGRFGDAVLGVAAGGAAIVHVKNESGIDLPRNSVLGLEDPIFSPGDSSLDAFMREVTFRGINPNIDAHKRRFCVLLEPAPIDGVVRAYVAGVCQVKVDVGDVSHEYATVVDGDNTALGSSRYGYAQILWREGDEGYGYGYGYETGLQWAIVRLGAHCPSVAVGKANGTITARSGTTFGTGKADIYRSDGGTADGPLETIDPVKNAGTAISDGKWLSIYWDMDGTAWVSPEECE